MRSQKVRGRELGQVCEGGWWWVEVCGGGWRSVEVCGGGWSVEVCGGGWRAGSVVNIVVVYRPFPGDAHVHDISTQ